MSGSSIGGGTDVLYTGWVRRPGGFEEAPPGEVYVNGLPAAGHVRAALLAAQAQARVRDAQVVAGLLIGRDP